MLKNQLKRVIIIVSLIIAAGVTGCSGISEEQIAQLETLRAEVKSMNTKIESLNNQKSILVRDIAEKNSKLEECAKLRSETQKNLDRFSH